MMIYSNTFGLPSPPGSYLDPFDKQTQHTFCTQRQALASEFPSAALVRPVYENLVNVHDLLRHPIDKSKAEIGGAEYGREGGQGNEDTRLPFNGRLLIFRRGNGVEEKTGRLLLKKLDYLQVLGE